MQVIDADPECALAYWGVAMSNFHALWLQAGTDYLIKGSQIISASNSIKKTEKEKNYINAIAGFFEDWESVSHKERVAKFESRMKGIYENTGMIKRRPFFMPWPDQPNHPGIAHYIMHNYDYSELAGLALSTARRYAEIAPASAHAQHMPSHIFTRLGLWDESVKSNLISVAVTLSYAESLDSLGPSLI